MIFLIGDKDCKNELVYNYKKGFFIYLLAST